jgi:hypothetical protein
MELTLPFFLKIFPNLLPSTFKTEVQEQEDMKKTLQLRLDLAKFLQDTVEQMAVRLLLLYLITSPHFFFSRECLYFMVIFDDCYLIIERCQGQGRQ